MANKKSTKPTKAKKSVKPAPKKVNAVKKNKPKAAPQKRAKVQKVQVSSISQAVVTESKKTYKIFGCEFKKSHVWIAVGIVVLLLLLF